MCLSFNTVSYVFCCMFRPYLEAVFHALECTENDYEALFALCLLYAMGNNEGKSTMMSVATYFQISILWNHCASVQCYSWV